MTDDTPVYKSKDKKLCLSPKDLYVDTLGLSVEEFGAYMRLLYCCWSDRQGCIRDDDGALSRVTGFTSKAYWVRKIRPSLEQFFLIEGGKWRPNGLHGRPHLIRPRHWEVGE